MSREPARYPTCPDAETLSAWLDEELDGAAAESVSRHIEACPACREQLFGWLTVAQELTATSELPGGGAHQDGLVERRYPKGGTRGRSATRVDRSDADSLLSEATAASATAAPCLDAESLVAYCESELDAGSTAVSERHLATCTRCVAEVQRLLALRRALAQQPAATPGAHTVDASVARWKWAAYFGEQAASLARRVDSRISGMVRGGATPPQAPRNGEIGDAPRDARALGPAPSVRGSRRSPTRPDHWLRAIGDLVRPRWAAVATLSAVAALVMTVARFAPTTEHSGDVQFRGAAPRERVEVISATAAGRPRPGDSEPILVILERGTVGVQLEAVRDWTRVELADGRRVWVESAQLARAGAVPRATRSR